MSKRCEICCNSKRKSIECDILNKLTARDIKTKYRLKSSGVVYKHSRNHITQKIKILKDKIKIKCEDQAIKKELKDLVKKDIDQLMEPIKRFQEGIRQIKIVADRADQKKGCDSCKLHLQIASKYFESVELEKKSIQENMDKINDTGEQIARLLIDLQAMKRIEQNDEMMQLLEEGLKEISAKSTGKIVYIADNICCLCGQ